MSDTVQFVKSQKGADKLAFDGYVYNKSENGRKKGYYKCERYKVCPGRIIFGPNCGVDIRQEHNHIPEPNRYYSIHT